MAGIRDVAKLAGVSTASVSRYLNNPELVRDKTGVIIAKAIDELHYIPNAHVKAIFNERSYNFAIIIPSADNPFYSEVIIQMESRANEYGYNMFLCNTLYSREKEKNYLKMLQENRTDGIIVVETTNPDLYKDINIPIVSLGTKVNDKSPLILSDDFKGGRIAFDYLKRLGAKKIAYIRSDSEIEFIDNQEQGFYNMKTDDIQIDKFVFKHIFDVKEQEDEFQKRFLGLEQYDAIFIHSDLYALKVIQYLSRLGLNHEIGKKIKVLGYGNFPFCEFSSPTLSSITVLKKEFSRIALLDLIDMINGDSVQDNRNIEVSLVERESTLGYK